jgi:preprotein translocase subunit SecE
MKEKLIEHLLSILFVTLVFVVLVIILNQREETEITETGRRVEAYLSLDAIDFGDPLDRTLFKETLDIFYPHSQTANDSILSTIDAFRQKQFTNRLYKTGGERRKLTWASFLSLSTMYVQFVLIYVAVMILTYYGARSLAIYRFIKMKQNKTSYLHESWQSLRHALTTKRLRAYVEPLMDLTKAVIKGISYFVLFAPAYVIAYSLKTEFDTNSYLFMIVLGVLSNGVLINYANKFYTILVSESRKGYVQTAVVKNLYSSYSWHVVDGISYHAVLRPKMVTGSHVFRHIYVNARYQYMPTLKEHASFLITGLIIIEMALNIQGHLGYDLLQNILFKEYDLAIAIILSIFLAVKATEILVDSWVLHESKRYENRK